MLVREPGATNFADLLTKHLTKGKLREHLERGGFEVRAGRPKGAAELAKGAARRRVAAVLGEALQGLDSQQPGVHRWVIPDGWAADGEPEAVSGEERTLGLD